MRRRHLLSAVLAVLGLVAGLVPGAGGTPAAQAQAFGSVDRQTAGGFAAGSADPAGSPAGTDPAQCTPSPAHPRPVVLVHGFTMNSQNTWSVLAPQLLDEGYCVFTLTYGGVSQLPGIGSVGGLGPTDAAVLELDAAVERARAATGSEQVDIVAHSKGTAVTAGFIKLHDDRQRIHQVVNVGGVMSGLPGPAELIPGLEELTGGFPGLAQLYRGDEYMERILATGSPLSDAVRYTNIVTNRDAIVRPYTAGLAEGAQAVNIVTQDGCPQDRTSHLSLVYAPRPVAMILDALDSEAAPRPIPCVG